MREPPHAAQRFSSDHMLVHTGPTFSERCNSPRGRLAVGSVVSHSLKSCGGTCLRCCALADAEHAEYACLCSPFNKAG